MVHKEDVVKVYNLLVLKGTNYCSLSVEKKSNFTKEKKQIWFIIYAQANAGISIMEENSLNKSFT